MVDHPQVTRRREYLEAFNRGDLAAARDFFDDDVVWHVAGNHPLSGDYRGKDALFAYFDAVNAQASLTLEATGILADDRYIATFLRVTGTRGTRELAVESCDML